MIEDRDYIIDQLQLHARQTALRIGRDPFEWPWPQGTTAGVTAQCEFEERAVLYGIEWARGWIDYMASQAAPRPGRPPGITTIESDAQLGETIQTMRRDRRRITRETVCAAAGFTLPELKGYLRKINCGWREFRDRF